LNNPLGLVEESSNSGQLESPQASVGLTEGMLLLLRFTSILKPFDRLIPKGLSSSKQLAGAS
jgi:hypothetical protein